MPETHQLEVRRVDARTEGSCNFCTRTVHSVTAVRGRSLTVRFCDDCLALLSALTA